MLNVSLQLKYEEPEVEDLSEYVTIHGTQTIRKIPSLHIIIGNCFPSQFTIRKFKIFVLQNKNEGTTSILNNLRYNALHSRKF